MIVALTRRRMIGGLLLGGAVPSSFRPAQAVTEDPEFRVFWRAWRRAVLDNDSAELARLIEPTLEVRRDPEAGPLERVTGPRVMEVLQRVLGDDSGVPARQPLTNRDLIRHLDPDRGLLPAVDTGLVRFRAASFVFSRRGGSWRLVRVYAGR